MKVKKIYIVTDAPIPVGFAPTNRILSYASGFKENGVECEIIIFRKTENYNEISNSKTFGKVNGAKYIYLFSSTVKSRYFVKRRWDAVIGALKLLYYALFKISRNSAIIYYSTYTYGILMLRIAKLFNPVVLLKEESEHPEVYTKIQNRLSRLFFTRIHYNLFDGFLLMTKTLIKYFRKEYPKIPSAHIPMTVDLTRFKSNKINDNKSLTYIGYLNDNKDGVNIIIKAFSKIIKKFPLYILSLYGEVSNLKSYKYYRNMALDAGIPDERIKFYGKVENNRIPQILVTSKLVLLARPESKQARAGFPTKLGEYLASGTPVIVTSVGEIPKYLNDGVTAYIAKPGDINSFAMKMEEALSNYDKAIQVGLQGRKIAEIYFNNIIQTKKIINFIKKF